MLRRRWHAGELSAAISSLLELKNLLEVQAEMAKSF
jgi:hypothetical protein